MYSDLVLLICTIVPIVQSFRTQSAGVRGILLCGNQPLKGAKVKLFDEDSGPDLDDLLDQGTTNVQGYFELSGHTSEISTIDPILKIYHDCDDGWMPCQREVTIGIPDSYVHNDDHVQKYFDVGTLNMESVFEKESRGCLNRS